jgi:hypothetical protein
MASSLIGALRVSLGLDTAQFESGAKKASSIAKREAGTMETSFKSARTAVEGLFAAFAIGALTEQIKKSLDYAGSIAEVAKTLGVTTTQLQQFRFAASQTGVSQEALELGLKKLTVSIGNAEAGSQKIVKAFGAIGIKVEQLKGQNTGEIFLKVADGLAKYSDRAQRASVETALMSRNGSLLDNMLSGGSARINQLSEAANRLGIVLSADQIVHAEETAHKLEAVKQILEAQIAGVVANNASAILSFSSALATLTSEIANFMSKNPRLVLGLLGTLLGLRLGGVGGAIAGGLGGAILGGEVARQAADSNTDLQVRMQAVRDAKAAYLAAQKRPSASSSTYRFGQNESLVAQAGSIDLQKLNSARAELERQTDLLNQAVAQSKASRAPQPPGVDLPKFLAPSGKKPRKGPEDRSEDISFQFAQQQRQVDLEILHAKQQLAGSSEDRAKLDVQIIQLEHEMQAAEIAHHVSQAQRDYADHKITKNALLEVEAGAKVLQARNDQLTQVQLQALIEDQLSRQEQALFNAADQRYKFQLDALHTADDLATTQADHRRIQLQILDEEIEQQRLELQHTKDLAIRNGATKQEIDNIQAQIDHLPAERAQGAATIARNTQSPLEQWRQEVPKTAAEINQALQSIEVKGLDGLSEAISGVITGTESLKDAFHNLAASVLQDLIQMTIKMLLFKTISAAFGGGPTFDQSTLNPFTQLAGARASGGQVYGGRAYLVGERGPELFMPKFSGSIVPNNRINFANDDQPMAGGPPGIHITTNIDATGADPAGLARVEASVKQLHDELPARVLGTMSDARDRFVWRGK